MLMGCLNVGNKRMNTFVCILDSLFLEKEVEMPFNCIYMVDMSLLFKTPRNTFPNQISLAYGALHSFSSLVESKEEN